MFAFHYEWIIIRIPQSIDARQNQQMKTKQKVQLSYWHDQRWHTEAEELIWSNDTVENLHSIITSWLTTIDAEQLVPKKVTLQTATIAPNNQDAYLSFDRNPLPKEWSTFSKWMLIEGLLKTIRENNIPIHHISFLVHHQPLHDTHLDFSNPWPITGFIAKIHS